MKHPTVTVGWWCGDHETLTPTDCLLSDGTCSRCGEPPESFGCGLRRLVPVVEGERSIHLTTVNGDWPWSVYQATFAAWHGAGWWEQATLKARADAFDAVRKWLDALAEGVDNA
jgi:hypothetical protein